MSERVTPVPIPNTAVKPLSADDSSNAKVGRCLDIILSFFITQNTNLLYQIEYFLLLFFYLIIRWFSDKIQV
ncbi:MAG: hypothetical protein UR53_C0002G0004 [Candidatus Magasanikbacteria bacterium GW2011_GWC2_34_16]|uniref:Uncharacterized protein n=2 Tax=Candidatus Magasanikiibacteriota TaxID=1752731 RepID=A0A0G0HPH0_9BACT|nr:MAG: hypothetical protein UR53_C0002G0004 [Candidatus Magasanikbacteria bacterium GW2011_GWC2_34_16]KKQ40505.1 MAG: hypothetical protein US58_C0019G0018 [Candidatus Magasanikbacteria bacterium GW2011_GWA2_37_8]